MKITKSLSNTKPASAGNLFQENKKMNNLQLKALRQGLGLTVADASELANVAKRTFQRWEDGTRSVPGDIDLLMDSMASHYSMVLSELSNDVDRATWRNTDPDNNPDKPMRVSPVLPFFLTFESFQNITKCSSVIYWRIYQSAISQLLLTGKISKLDDSAVIPAGFWIWKWFGGEFNLE